MCKAAKRGSTVSETIKPAELIPGPIHPVMPLGQHLQYHDLSMSASYFDFALFLSIFLKQLSMLKSTSLHPVRRI